MLHALATVGLEPPCSSVYSPMVTMPLDVSWQAPQGPIVLGAP